jgi:hypothetical protein
MGYLRKHPQIVQSAGLRAEQVYEAGMPKRRPIPRWWRIEYIEEALRHAYYRKEP